MVDESAKQSTENDDANNDQFDSSLPPELRKLMEQSKQREREEAAAAAAAEAQNKDETTSGTQGPSDEIQNEKDLTQSSLDRKKSIKDDKLFNGIDENKKRRFYSKFSVSFLASADEILEQLADESVVDLRSHWPILPLLQISLSHIPPQPKKVQDWTIMQGWLFINNRTKKLEKILSFSS